MRWQHRLMVGLAVVLTGAAMATTGKLANGTGNLSKARREALIGKIEAIKQFLQDSQDPNAEQLLAYTRELSQEVRAKKFGLVFEEHRERVDVVLEENLPIVREEATRFLDHGGELNFLIEGENLAALKLLAKTHRGKVDVIYIDPPYNTGNKDFVYNDSYVDANDLFRHSKWLSFMEKRLKIARELLADTGVIFISIDDNEQATLKLLCDDVFGAENFVNNVVIKMSEVSGVKMSHIEKKLPKLKEFCLVYCKEAFRFKINPIVMLKSDKPEKMESYAKYYSKIILDKSKPVEDWEILPLEDYCQRMNIDIYNAKGKKDKRKELEFKLQNAERMVYRTNNQSFANIVCDKKLARVKSSRGLEYIWWEGKQMLFLSDYIKEFAGDLWTDISTINLNKEGYVDFSNGKKPLKLLERCLTLSPKSDALVLDFFAGSGTTGHAVMKLNAADGGKRRFILVTNNENGICERVTYERLRRVMEKEGYAARLKYLKVDYVPIKERLYYEYANELLGAIRELVELENGIDFAREQGVAIVQTDEELAALVADEARLAACRKLYKGHEVLMGNKQKATLRRAGIEVLEIPQYYYPELED